MSKTNHKSKTSLIKTIYWEHVCHTCYICCHCFSCCLKLMICFQQICSKFAAYWTDTSLYRTHITWNHMIITLCLKCTQNAQTVLFDTALQWRTGSPGNREISWWDPASGSFLGPGHTRKIISLTQSAAGSAFSARVPCESEWANDSDVSYSFTCRLPPTRIKTISDENKITILPFLWRIRIARNADHCNSQTKSVCLSVHHVPVLCPEEWRYYRAVFSIRYIGRALETAYFG